MASYAFGIEKEVETGQGGMSVCNVSSGRLFFNTLPNNAYFFKDVDWWRANGYVYYASEYPNLRQTYPTKLLDIAQIGATHIYACIYVSDPNYPPDFPISEGMGDDVTIKLFTGDNKGDKTELNPSGYRFAVNEYNFLLWDISDMVVVDVGGTEISSHRYYQERGTNYGFFATIDGNNQLYFMNAPRLAHSVDTQLDVSPYGLITWEKFYKTATMGELMTNEEFVGIGAFQLYDLSGEPIEIELLKDGDGTSTTGGGSGSFDLSTGNIDFPPLPTLGAANSGLLTLYNPSLSELNALSRWLWSNDLLDVLEKMYAQPMDLIVTLNVVPCEPSSLGAYQYLKIGGVETRIQMQKINNQYAFVDCGSINMREFFGSALDYGTYTKISLFLPFINTVQLKTDEVMGAIITVGYNVDLFSGSCTAMVRITRDGIPNILYSFEGNIATSIPLISRDFSNVYSGIVKSGVNALYQAQVNPSSTLTSAINVMSAKPEINRTGGVTSMGGLLGVKTPYLIIERPVQSLARGYNKFVGYPSNITSILSDLTGYTEIDEVIGNGLSCTDEEQNEIIDLLKSGVYI